MIYGVLLLLWPPLLNSFHPCLCFALRDLYRCNCYTFCRRYQLDNLVFQNLLNFAGMKNAPLWSGKGWCDEFDSRLNIIIDIVQKVYEWSRCPLAEMIPWLENHFGKITAWSLIYSLNYAYYDVCSSRKFDASTFSRLAYWFFLAINKNFAPCPHFFTTTKLDFVVFSKRSLNNIGLNYVCT